MKSVKLICRTLVFGLALSLTLAMVPLAAQTRGMIMDNATGKAVVFDADTDTVTGSVTIGVSGSIGACSITLDQAFGFATRFDSNVYVIQLSPPALAQAPNPIPISNLGEDTSLTPNGKQVVVCDGGAPGPVSVVDVASHAELGTLGTGSRDCNSVDVSSTGSVLVTSAVDNNVRRLTIDTFGSLTNTNEVMDAGGQPNNVIAAPGGASGIVINGSAATIKSFTIPGLTPVGTRAISGFGISGLINSVGDKLYVRTNGGSVNVFSYNSGTGAIGAAPLFSFPIDTAFTFFGIDQMALHPNGSKLYVSQPGAVKIYDPTTGALLGSITSPGNISQPTGICLPVPECTAPIISGVGVSKSSLWPPNHKMVDITVEYTQTSNCPSTCTLSVTSNEPIDGLGDGNTSPDWLVVDATHVQLRAERSGRGSGRIYTITITCTNSAGQSSTATVTVTVPHDQG